MHTVELYAHVRRYVMVEGHSRRAAAREYGISREMVAKMVAHAVPPRYQRSKPPFKPKLDPFLGFIDEVLRTDQDVSRKQRHTARRIFERLQKEHGYTGGYTQVKDYVRTTKRHHQEMFIPLIHPPGHAQVDFGEAWVRLAGQDLKAHFFAMIMPHSDAPFVIAFPAETTESFLAGHVAAFAFFGGVPQSILYDNTKLAVAKIIREDHLLKERIRTVKFTELVSHFLFQDRFGRPGRGNDKGNVEGLVKYIQRTFLTPIPDAADWAELNLRLEERCRQRQEERTRGEDGTIGERLLRDIAVLQPLPAAIFDACSHQPGTVTSQSLVRFKTNDYSVPTAYGHQKILIKAYVETVEICLGAEVIARHERSYGREELIFNPLHYLSLLEMKVGALDQAAPLAGWDLPEGFLTIRRLLEARQGKQGRREYVSILCLHNNFSPEQVHRGVLDALRLGAIAYDAVKHLIMAAIEQRPLRLDLAHYPHLPATEVRLTQPEDYNALLCTTAAP
jgi:transposase